MGIISDAIFGKSGNKAVSTLTPEQRALMNNYLSTLNAGAGQNVNTLQGYANNAYNPYDAVEGDRLVGEMGADIRQSGRRQLEALKGGPLNRFSLASAKAAGDINENVRDDVTGLDYQNLMTKANFGQQSYANQMGALGALNTLGTNLTGMTAIQNQATKKPGALDYINAAGQTLGTLKAIKAF
jgi:hypothetical protein